MLLFPKLGDPSVELLGATSSDLYQVLGASGSWLFVQLSATLVRIPMP